MMSLQIDTENFHDCNQIVRWAPKTPNKETPGKRNRLLLLQVIDTLYTCEALCCSAPLHGTFLTSMVPIEVKRSVQQKNEFLLLASK
jgi:hypothetical protein